MKINHALFSAAILANAANAFDDTDKRNCTGHPDPHFRNFHSLPFDFQSGCDVVLSKNDNIEIHARLAMMGRYSAVRSIGAKIGNQIVLLESDSALIDGMEVNALPVDLDVPGYSLDHSDYLGSWVLTFPEFGGLYVGNNVGKGAGKGDDGGIKDPDRPHEDSQDKIDPGNEPWFHGRKLDDEGRLSSNMSFRLEAGGVLFQGSSGLCGEWDNDEDDGTVTRDGTILDLPPLFPNSFWNYNGTELGLSFRVDSDEGDSDEILANAVIPSPSQWNADECVPMSYSYARRRERRLQLGLGGCDICDELNSPIQQEICQYDADVLGCDNVEDVLQDFYTNDSPWFEDMGDGGYEGLKCLDVAARQMPTQPTPKKGKAKKNEKANKRGLNQSPAKSVKVQKSEFRQEKVKKCHEKGGECVVMCNPFDEGYECKAGLCNVDIEVEEASDILVNNKYYSKCSCRIPV